MIVSRSPKFSSHQTRASHRGNSRRKSGAFTLTEAVICIAICGMTLGSLITGYVWSATVAQRSVCSLAANSMAMQRIEQARAARWDSMRSPPVDELVSSNFPQVVRALDLPITGSNVVYGTNVVTITTVSSSPPLRLIRSETRWALPNMLQTATNTVFVYRGPD